MEDNIKRKILIADSCAGGISVLKNIMQCNNTYFYFIADGEKNPFGIKSELEINSIVEDWLIFAKNNDFKFLVVACNTASIAAYKKINFFANKYGITIITMADALILACEKNKDLIQGKNIAIFGTKFTVESELYLSILNKYNPKRIYMIPGTESERLVARGLFKDVNQLNKTYNEIKKYSDKNIDTFILACTCFEFLKDMISYIYKDVAFVNPSELVLELFEMNLNSRVNNKQQTPNTIKFATTGELDDWSLNINIITNKVFNQSVDVKSIKIR